MFRVFGSFEVRARRSSRILMSCKMLRLGRNRRANKHPAQAESVPELKVEGRSSGEVTCGQHRDQAPVPTSFQARLGGRVSIYGRKRNQRNPEYSVTGTNSYGIMLKLSSMAGSVIGFCPQPRLIVLLVMA